MTNSPAYLDYMATTPVDPAVALAMREILEQAHLCGNASSSHAFGHEIMDYIDQAREQVAQLIHADPREITWTSGATEANNLAILGVAQAYNRKGKHIITMGTEHKSILNTCGYLSQHGYEIAYLDPDANGLLPVDRLREAIRPDTLLISIMHVNNETGAIQDLQKLGQCAKEQGVLFHVDAAQSIGKLTLDVSSLPIDLVSLSAHKFYGPKGIGALYIRRTPPIRLAPQMHGGRQEKGIRPGTLPTHQIVGMGKAAELAGLQQSHGYAHIVSLRDRLWSGIANLPGISLNVHFDHAVPHCLSLLVEGIESEALILAMQHIAISSGSACNSVNLAPSHVLMATGLTRAQANQSVRISFGRFSTAQDIDIAISDLTEQIQRLRALHPA